MNKYRLHTMFLGLLALLTVVLFSYQYIHFSICISIIIGLFVIHTTITVLGAYFIQLNYFIRSINKGVLTTKSVALTFDDGPHDNTQAVLDVLAKYQVPATFFIIGKNIASKESTLQQIDAAGHRIGNHSFEHSYWYSIKPVKELVQDIQKNNALIESVIHEKVRWFRPPYGVTNPRIASAITNTRMQSIGWNIRSYDTVGDSVEKTLARITYKLKGSDIVLMHDSLDTTAQLLEKLILHCQKEQIEIVSLEKLIEQKAYE
ncbi:MAG: polysaccharide deacetylase family protein [Bacteroidota bacterium]